MNQYILALLFFTLCLNSAWCQEVTVPSDSIKLLNEVTVEAFDYGRTLKDVPASVGYIGASSLERFNNSSILPAINTIPGVRMEERSPGSYRFSIRGSTLRSPFGIRNVKVYLNDIPFTDPGGNTYLNLLDYNSIQAVEVIKGPGGSLYGAGTGGVILLKGLRAELDKTNIRLSTLAGSYGLLRYSLTGASGEENANTVVQYSHQQSDGYRDQTAFVRDAAYVQGSYRVSEKRVLKATILYSDLVYQIPGGINREQFDANPSWARQAGGPFLSAVDQKTAVYNKTFFTGLNHEYQLNDRWSNRMVVYGSFTQFTNPFIDKYEKRNEQSVGGRTNFLHEFRNGKLNFGAEFQHGFSPVNEFDNNRGTPGATQKIYEITSTSSFAFLQGEVFLPYNFYLTAGASLNFFRVNYVQFSNPTPYYRNKGFDPVISPRVALLKKINEDVSLFGSISKGFSPPTVAELYPSAATFNNDLNPEKGVNFEAGGRGSLFNNKLNIDLTAYSFQLKETIVVAYSAAGSDHFINAGATKQRGLELQVSWHKSPAPGAFVTDFSVWTSATLNHYRFAEYVQDSVEYSNNELTGVPPVMAVAGVDLSTRIKIYANITATYTDKIPLNNANSVYADAYTLLGIRMGYRNEFSKKVTIDIFAGIDNALNERYSLGNDLNAFGGRYYNAAPPINFYGGLTAGLSLGK